MVRDVRSAVDLVLCLTAAGRTIAKCRNGEATLRAYPALADKLPLVDASRIVLAGDSS